MQLYPRNKMTDIHVKGGSKHGQIYIIGKGEKMYIPGGLIQHKLLIPILILITIFSLSVNNAEAIVPADNEGPIYEIPISESTQHDIWELCEENEFPYELMLSIYEVEGLDNIKHDDIKADLKNLVYYRDYWGKQGYPDEYVFDLILISRLRGIEGGLTYMKYKESYDLYNYVQAVAEYKSYLEQSLDETSNINKPKDEMRNEINSKLE